MSLIITKNFKRAKAQDVAARDRAPDGWWEGKTIFAAFGWGKSVKGKVVSHKGGVIKLEDGTQFKESDAYDLYAIDSSASDAAAKDIQLPFIITFNNGKKEFREGYSEEEVRRRFDKSIAALYGGIKSVKLEGEDKRDGKDSIAADAKFKERDDVFVKMPNGHEEEGTIVKVYTDHYDVKLWDSGVRAVGFSKVRAMTAADSCATDYDPNPQTRGKDIEVFSAQAIREESACENVLRKVIEDVEALVIKIHGPMSSWEEVIENSEMSPELPQAKKWSGTANRRYDYLLARERAISSILSELKRNHID